MTVKSASLYRFSILGAFTAAALVYFLYKDLFSAAEAAKNIVRGESVGFAGVFRPILMNISA
ncbi:glycerol uptake facilitator protein [Actinobacillus equuli]|nr:glycerol uptake facilitator protein [Actinobacillus equuli]